MRDLPIIKVYKATDIIRLLIFSSWDPLHLQTNRVLRAKLKNFNSKPVQIQFNASDFYNSTRRLAISEPLDKWTFKIGAKDSREKSMAASSLQVELLEHSEGSQSLWHTLSSLRVITEQHPVARASE